jgi:hypothetical protein
LSRPFVEGTGDLIETLFGMHREVGEFGEILAEESVAVLVLAPLPRLRGDSWDHRSRP